MTKREIEQGAGLLLAALKGCDQVIAQLHPAVRYCYEQERRNRKLSPKGYAGFLRIHKIWTGGIEDVPQIFCGDAVRDRDMARGTLMAIFVSATILPAETIQIPIYAETCLLLKDLLEGGWYE